jgi:transposase
MRKGYQKSKELARAREVFIGVDVHKDSWHVTIRQDGEEAFHGRIPSSYQVFKKLLERCEDCTIKVAYEAGPCGFWLYDKLTDKRDSRKLAHLLERNMLKRVYVLSEADRADRELVRTRRQILEHRSDVLRQIKSKLLFHGIKIPFTYSRTWTEKYVKWLKGLTFESEQLRIAFDYLIELCEYLTAQLIRINKKVIEMAKSEKYSKKVQLLKSVPGIGTLVAIEMLVELQDVERFSSADKLAAYIGLTPSEYSTGQYVRQGRITRCGNKRVRTCAVEACWIFITKDVLIAIARNLMVRIRRILLNNEPYASPAVG